MTGSVTLGSNDREHARAFCSAPVAEIGGREVRRPNHGFTRYGTGPGQPGPSIAKRCDAKAAVPGNGTRAALVLKRPPQVDAGCAKALARGGTDEGAPVRGKLSLPCLPFDGAVGSC